MVNGRVYDGPQPAHCGLAITVDGVRRIFLEAPGSLLFVAFLSTEMACGPALLQFGGMIEPPHPGEASSCSSSSVLAATS
jgi:hypothetical protein